MSARKLAEECDRWRRQSLDDLEAATALLAAGKHAQSCFFAHQAAEKSIKALVFHFDGDPWGHSVTKLVEALPDLARKEFEPMKDTLLSIDRLYIPTRYPDALAGLIPAEAFSLSDAHRAMADVQQIFSVVDRLFRVGI